MSLNLALLAQRRHLRGTREGPPGWYRPGPAGVGTDRWDVRLHNPTTPGPCRAFRARFAGLWTLLEQCGWAPYYPPGIPTQPYPTRAIPATGTRYMLRDGTTLLPPGRVHMTVLTTG